MTINDFLDNSLSLSASEIYAGILGANPSQGARSPILWNNAFKAHGLNRAMYPMDVSTNNLFRLLEYLDEDINFIGGAVAVPHKEKIAHWLTEQGDKYISEEAATIGAVNSLYRAKDGHIRGTNTDGEAALISLKQARKDIEGVTVLLIGPGGAGKAVATYVKKAIKSGKLIISARNPSKINLLSKKLNAQVVKWPVQSDILKKVDILINCTVLGSRIKTEIDGKLVTFEEFNPLSKGLRDETAISELQNIKSDAVIFDIIYDPNTTKLLKLAAAQGLKTLNGKQMNLEQAVLSFEYAVSEAKERTFIRESMLQATS